MEAQSLERLRGTEIGVLQASLALLVHGLPKYTLSVSCDARDFLKSVAIAHSLAYALKQVSQSG